MLHFVINIKIEDLIIEIMANHTFETTNIELGEHIRKVNLNEAGDVYTVEIFSIVNFWITTSRIYPHDFLRDTIYNIVSSIVDENGITTGGYSLAIFDNGIMLDDQYIVNLNKDNR